MASDSSSTTPSLFWPSVAIVALTVVIGVAISLVVPVPPFVVSFVAVVLSVTIVSFAARHAPDEPRSSRIDSSGKIRSPMQSVKVELAFPAEYDVRVPMELPGRSPAIEFAGGGGSRDGGVLVEVTGPSGDTWSGVVASAPPTVSAAHSGVYSTPAPGQLCVVARGEAYFIDAADPARYWRLEDAPIVDVRSVLDDGVLALATPWKVIGIDAQGVKWRTSRLAIDGIELGDFSDGWLRGVADPRDYESREFIIEVRSGYHRGGFPFPG